MSISHPHGTATTPIDGNILDPMGNEELIREKDAQSNSGSDDKTLNKEKDKEDDLERGGVSVGVKAVDSESMSTGEINYKTMSWQRCAAVSNRVLESTGHGGRRTTSWSLVVTLGGCLNNHLFKRPSATPQLLSFYLESTYALLFSRFLTPSRPSVWPVESSV